MFKLTVCVEAVQLHNILTVLQNDFGLDVEIDPIIMSAVTPVRTIRNKAQKRGPRGPYKKAKKAMKISLTKSALAQVATGQTAHQRAVNLIHGFGVPPFQIGDLLSRGSAVGLTNPTIYRAVRQEVDAGRLSKLEPGRYQRTGASWVESLGFNKAS